MAKVKFNREKGNDISKIKVNYNENDNIEERIKKIFENARKSHPEKTVSKNWPDYEKIDGRPEKE